MKRVFRFLCAAFILLSIALPAMAKNKIKYPPNTSMVEVTNRTQKHFDANRDGWLNRHENSLLTTHLRFGYPLVKKRKQRPYDFNGDLMLEPFEWQMYTRDKESGTLRKKDETGSGVRR